MTVPKKEISPAPVSLFTVAADSSVKSPSDIALFVEVSEFHNVVAPVMCVIPAGNIEVLPTAEPSCKLPVWLNVPASVDVMPSMNIIFCPFAPEVIVPLFVSLSSNVIVVLLERSTLTAATVPVNVVVAESVTVKLPRASTCPTLIAPAEPASKIKSFEAPVIVPIVKLPVASVAAV